MRWIQRVLLAVAANGVLLAVAALLFDEFELSFTGWIIGAALFTVFTVVLRGVAASLARKYASGATFVGGLVLTWVGLLLTDLFTDSDKFDLEGASTWLLTTLIVWIGTVIYDQVDDRLIDSLRGDRDKDTA
jgi:hypothetical protein